MYSLFYKYYSFEKEQNEHYTDSSKVPLKKNMVFSSVGNNTSFDRLWVGDHMNYDIYVIYYGNDDEIYNMYKDKVTFIEKRKGSKFHNLKYFYDTYPDIISTYERFFILDDDIIMNVNDINTMFELSRKYNLKICAPSFLPQSKISHKLTLHKPGLLLRYTNFVEMNTPLFSVEALHKLMKVFDYSIIGWGTDYLYIVCNGIDDQKSYAIIDSITCINPKDDDKKSKKRELDLIENNNKEEQLWLDFAKKHNYPSKIITKEYSSIPL